MSTAIPVAMQATNLAVAAAGVVAHRAGPPMTTVWMDVQVVAAAAVDTVGAMAEVSMVSSVHSCLPPVGNASSTIS
jgi:hypothetical protein